MGRELIIQNKEARVRQPGPAEGERDVGGGGPRQRAHNLLSPERRPPTLYWHGERLLIVSVFNEALWQRYKLSKKKRALGLEKAWHGLNKAE